MTLRVVVLALLAMSCDAFRPRSGGTIPASKFALHAVPGSDRTQVACVDVEFRHLGPPAVSWHCTTEVRVTGAPGNVSVPGVAASAADVAGRHVTSLGMPESADEACRIFHERMQAQLAPDVPGARVGPFDNCTKHHLPQAHFP